jgi:hypothetical protein
MQDFVKSDGGLLVPAVSKLAVGGVFSGVILRGGHFDEDGLWRSGTEIVDEFEFHNLCVDEGITDGLSVMLGAGTQKPSWYCGVFEGNYTPVAGVTAATIASASTECTAYASSTRPAWTPAAASAKSITNSASKASFVFNATKTIYGAFLVSSNTKSGTGGVLFAASRFAASKAVANTDELQLTYTVTGSSS